MTLHQLSRQEFHDFIQKAQQKSFLQSLEMADLLEKRGFTVTFLGYTKDGDTKVAALTYSKAMTGGLFMEVNSGPVSLDASYLKDFYKSLQDYAKGHNVLELLVKPYEIYQTFDSDGKSASNEEKHYLTDLLELGYQHDGLQTGYPGGEPDWHYVKDLSDLTEKNLLASFSKKGKPLLKKAKTFGIQLRPLKKEELHLFKEITEATSDRREYSDKSLDYYQDFYDSFKENAEFMVATLNFQEYWENLHREQGKIKQKLERLETDLEKNPTSEKKQNQYREFSSQYQTFEVRKAEAQEFIQKYGDSEQILAGSLFVYTPQEAVYLFSGSYPEFNKFYAPALLQEHVMLESIKRGIAFYNFLGIQGIFDGSDGVLRFKQNFNGYIQRRMGTFRYYPNPIKYKIIQILKKVLGRK